MPPALQPARPVYRCCKAAPPGGTIAVKHVTGTSAIETVVVPPTRDLGDDFQVRRALPAAQRRAVGPFVFFDQMGPALLRADSGLDVRPHPHIGLATVTYLFEGEITHRDSLGSIQAIRTGELNWMIAGRGIVHSERTPAQMRRAASTLYGIQTWIALPQAAEECAPSFQHFAAAQLPLVEAEGASLRLIAGELYGAPVATLAPMFYADLKLAAGARLPLTAEHAQRAIYILQGQIDVDAARCDAGQLVVLNSGRDITLHAQSSARAMLLGGEPLDGPRHVWWNFVSSSRERIEQAKRDWRGGRMGRVAGDEEFIPLPSEPAVQTPPVDYP